MLENIEDVLSTPGGQKIVQILRELEAGAKQQLLNSTAERDLQTGTIKYNRGLLDMATLALNTLKEKVDGAKKV